MFNRKRRTSLEADFVPPTTPSEQRALDVMEKLTFEPPLLSTDELARLDAFLSTASTATHSPASYRICMRMRLPSPPQVVSSSFGTNLLSDFGDGYAEPPEAHDSQTDSEADSKTSFGSASETLMGALDTASRPHPRRGRRIYAGEPAVFGDDLDDSVGDWHRLERDISAKVPIHSLVRALMRTARSHAYPKRALLLW